MKSTCEFLLTVIIGCFFISSTVSTFAYPFQFSKVENGVPENVKMYADRINEFEPGTVVYIHFYGDQSMLQEVESIYITTWHLLFSRQDVRLIIYVCDEDGQDVLTNEFDIINPLDRYGVVEGEDYIVLPYRAMSEDTIIAFTADLRSIFTKDWRNVDLNSYPLWQDISDFNDVDWYIGGEPELATRLFFLSYGVKLLCWGGGASLLPYVPPFWGQDGPVYGYVGGIEQGEQLQRYVDFTETMYLSIVTDGYYSGGGYYPKGSTATFSVYNTTRESGNGVRYHFTGWSSDSPGGYTGSDNPAAVILNNNIIERANWRIEYHLSIESSVPMKGEGWYEKDSTIILNAESPRGFISRKVFKVWRGGIDSSEERIEITMDGPITIEVEWVTDNSQLRIIGGIAAVFVFAAILLIRRR